MNSPAPRTMLSLHGLRKRYGANEVLRGIDLNIPSGARHAIIGPNGAGKSTLFDVISGRARATAGIVRLKGENITGLAPHLLARRGLARSFQISSLFANLSTFENILGAVLAAGNARHIMSRPLRSLHREHDLAEEILTSIGLGAQRDNPAAELSYAEQRALELGVSIAGNPQVILLDEPTAGMSRDETRAAMALIHRMSQGRTLLIVEHDMDVVFNVAERISVLVRGQVLASDTPEAIRGNHAVRDAYLGALEID